MTGYDDYGYAPSMWSETALVTIQSEYDANDENSGNLMHFKTITDTVDPDLGEKGFDTIANLAGGRLVKFTPETDSTVSLDLYPVAAGNWWSSSGEEAAGFYDLLHTMDGSYDPVATDADALQVISNDRTRTRYRLTLLWTNDTTATNAVDSVAVDNKAALRLSMCGYFTKATLPFTDDGLKCTITFKAPAFKKDGTANVRVDSTDDAGTTALPTLNLFTSTTNF